MTLAQTKALHLRSIMARSAEVEPNAHQKMQPLVASACGNVDNDKQRLDDFVASALGAIKGFVGQDPSRLMEALEESAIDCDACAARSTGHVCCGDGKDYRTLSEGGACWQWLRELFSSIVDWVGRRYSAVLGPNLAPLEVRLRLEDFDPRATDRERAFPHDFRAPVRAGARTEFEDRAGGLRSTVTLTVDTQALDSRTLLTIPYLLLHEVVCHAFQGWKPDGARPRRDALPTDGFVEGWMDTYAADALTALVRSHDEDPWPPPEALEGSIQQMEVDGQNFHSARGASRQVEGWAERRQGRRVRGHLLGFLTRDRGPTEAYRLLMALSLRLNGSVRDADERADLLQSLDALTPNQRQRGRHPGENVLEALLAKYFQDKDLSYLRIKLIQESFDN